MEEHDNDDTMVMEEGEHHYDHPDHHNHEEIHPGGDDTEDEEHMDIEPSRIEAVATTTTAAAPTPDDRNEFLDHDPTKDEIWEMKKANKRPSEWLKLLCKDWAQSEENIELIETVDAKFESYKPYLKGKMSSQLLCRLCIPSPEMESAKNSSSPKSNGTINTKTTRPDFVKNILTIQDEFDKAYVTAQVERFCALYDIRGIKQQAAAATAVTAASNASISKAHSTPSRSSDTNSNVVVTTTSPTSPAKALTAHFPVPDSEAAAAAAAALYGDLVVNAALDVHHQAIAAAAAATAANASSVGGVANVIPPHLFTNEATAAAVAAAQQVAAAVEQKAGKNADSTLPSGGTSNSNKVVFANNKTARDLLTRAQQQAKLAERALEQERKQNAKREQKRLSLDKKLARQRDREFMQKQKMSEKLAREQVREDKRTQKLMQRHHREQFAQEQKEAALRRAAELVASNRVPIEITRSGGRRKVKSVASVGAAATRTSKTKAIASVFPKKRARSAIVVSTASDLDRIVTHSQNLWAKYNAIAKEHNQRVNWITVAKELGIHVKVREKYARMHSRACQREFDFVKNGHWKIKDHPEIFQEPTAAEQKARMPPPLPPTIDSTTVAEIEAKLLVTAAPTTTLPTKEAPAIPVTDTNPMSASGVVAEPSRNGTQQQPQPQQHQPGHQHLNSVDAAAAAATAAAVVDAAGVGGATIAMQHVVELTSTATTTEGFEGASSGNAIKDENTNTSESGNAMLESSVTV